MGAMKDLYIRIYNLVADGKEYQAMWILKSLGMDAQSNIRAVKHDLRKAQRYPRNPRKVRTRSH